MNPIRNIAAYGITVEEKQGDGLRVICDGQRAVIEYANLAQKNRGYYLIQSQLKKGNKVFDIAQKQHFDTCGPMLDVSRGGVMTVEAVNDFVDATAALGLNMLMLYTEEVYDLEEQPMFGYMRGKYTLEEMQTIDEHAASVGVEIIPCIQTLGHLANFLRWGTMPKETPSVVLPDEEKVYEFIEQEIAFMRKAFRSDRIHIGMDEADWLGHGQHFRKHGYEEPLTIFNRHLERVLGITRKYGYQSMIWADMYFGAEDAANYYVEDAVIPQFAIDSAPKDVELIFWDYYHTNYSYYDKKLVQYERFPNPVGFGGGIWTWDGFVPNFRYSAESMVPALQAALDHGVKTVLATMWANDGCECCMGQAKSSLAIFSEMCYLGKDCTMDDIWEAAEYVSGENPELIAALDSFYDGEEGSVRIGKAVFYCDPLIDTFCRDMDFARLSGVYENALRVIEKHPDYALHDYYRALFRIVAAKAKLLHELPLAYKNGDKETARRIAQQDIPAIVRDMESFYRIFRAKWRKENKPFGWEKYPIRFAGLAARLKDVGEILLDWADGSIDRIEELDEKRVSGINVTWQTAAFYTNF